MLGKNIINHSEDLQENAQMDNSSYSKLIHVIKKDPEIVKNYYFKYTAYDTNKISYANRLDPFNGVLFIAADYDVIRDTHMQATLRTLLPLMICLILSIYTLYRYLYLIKYTDYFTEVKNDLAFRKRLEKHLTTGVNEENYLVLKIENVIHSKNKDFMYDDSVFYNISNYFKLLSPYYEDLYRISRVHYVFVLKRKSSQKHISNLLHKIQQNISNKTKDKLNISGKILLIKLDDIKSIVNLNDVDNKILSCMDDYYNNLMQVNLTHFIKYNDIIQSLDIKSKERTLIENAIVNKKIIAHYQPIVSLQSGDILKHEVLLRIKDIPLPFSTAEFIEKAEDENLINKVDQIMIREAFKKYNQRLLITGKRTPLSINISCKSINEDMKKYIFDLVKKCDIKTSDITFELTETSQIENCHHTISFLNHFREKGFKIAIDDFGTGYSHVALLSKLQVDYVKIDGIFIKNMHHDKQKLKTLNALVYLAKNYNTKVIAEYMDSIDSIEVLKKIGVEYGQGHYFGQAVPEIR
jgi:EAL domain-containing protein (putative c-di-GMP-specific phosphodiesterase class I)